MSSTVRSFFVGVVAGSIASGLVAWAVVSAGGSLDGPRADADIEPGVRGGLHEAEAPAGPTGRARRTSPSPSVRADADADVSEAESETGSVVIGSFELGDPSDWVPDPLHPLRDLDAAIAAAKTEPGLGEIRLAEIVRLTGSADGAEALRGVGLAARLGQFDVLFEVAGERGDGPVRRAAVAAAARYAPDDARTIDVLRAAWRENSAPLRDVVLAVLPSANASAASALALELLHDGGRSPEALRYLAAAAIGAGNEAALIREAPDAEVALALAIALRRDVGWADRFMTPPGTSHADNICDALLPWLRGDGDWAARAQAALFVTQARRWDRVATLVTDPAVRSVVRQSVLASAMQVESDANLYSAALAAFIHDPTVSSDVRRVFVSGLERPAIENAVIRAAMTALAERGDDPWLREAARAALQQLRPSDARDLQIVRATYGAAETWLDVTESLRTLVVGGRLVVEASNQIESDPLVNVQKVLHVEFIHGGRRYKVSVKEYETLSIP